MFSHNGHGSGSQDQIGLGLIGFHHLLAPVIHSHCHNHFNFPSTNMTSQLKCMETTAQWAWSHCGSNTYTLHNVHCIVRKNFLVTPIVSRHSSPVCTAYKYFLGLSTDVAFNKWAVETCKSKEAATKQNNENWGNLFRVKSNFAPVVDY